MAGTVETKCRSTADKTARRAALLAKACRNAHVQILLDAMNAWALDPTEGAKRAATKAMDRYRKQVSEGAFPAADKAPFGPSGNGHRFGLPADLPRLLAEAKEILPTLIEAEERAKLRRITEAQERSRETRRSRKVAQGAAVTA